MCVSACERGPACSFVHLCRDSQGVFSRIHTRACMLACMCVHRSLCVSMSNCLCRLIFACMPPCLCLSPLAMLPPPRSPSPAMYPHDMQPATVARVGHTQPLPTITLLSALLMCACCCGGASRGTSGRAPDCASRAPGGGPRAHLRAEPRQPAAGQRAAPQRCHVSGARCHSERPHRRAATMLPFCPPLLLTASMFYAAATGWLLCQAVCCASPVLVGASAYSLDILLGFACLLCFVFLCACFLSTASGDR